MTPREDAVVVEGATERPWHVGNIRTCAIYGPVRDVHDDDAVAEVPHWSSQLEPRSPRGAANRDLIVSAVNAYDRLRRVETAARSVADHHNGGHDPNDRCWPTLRDALSEPVA